LRNREAARYARWAAVAAGLIVAVVVGMYAERAFREARARREAPKAVAVTVQQQSAQFSFSKVEQDRTIFTIRASRATQYKDQNRTLLEDVWITIYGRDGSRNDNIHTRECSYEPETGAVRCEGEVQINVESAAAPGRKPSGPLPDNLQIKTSNLSFNRNTGEASTPAAVEFRFAAGQGHGIGAFYSTRDGIVRVERDIAFEMPPRAGGLPIDAACGSLEIRRNDRTVVMRAPATVKQGARELAADQILVELDKDYHARRVLAEGHPKIHAGTARGKVAIAADHLEGLLSAEGWVERVIAEGNIDGNRQTPAGTDHFSAQHVEFAMIPARNLIDSMTASGGVTAELHQGSDTHVLKTDAVRVKFSTDQVGQAAGAENSLASIDRQRVESLETLTPATIESKSAKDTTTLQAKKFVAEVGLDGRLDRLLGHSGVDLQRQTGSGAPQIVSATEMVATFDTHGEWNTVDESGNVRFRQLDREATAARARISRATDTIALEGSPVISDAMSRTTASSVTINQSTGELRATGGVVSTYIPTAKGNAVALGSGAAHVSADELSGSATSGHVTYVGHARLWQGDSVLDSDQIELWRDDKKLRATGHVVAVFPQTSGPLMSIPGASAKAGSPAAPVLWRISAPVLTYWNDQGKAHLEGGVTATSDQGSLESKSLDAFLAAAAAAGAPGATAPPGGQQLNRVLAQGDVIVRQGDRRGSAEQGEYTAADGKFVLSGGQPTLANAASDTTTGHSLTFFVANDTILVDSEEGSRTVTKHRVEK